jgi:1-aminocyclopropane-1-carboxylate deaminase
LNTQNQKINFKNISNNLYIKREDLIHPLISGNKYRKLKYNLQEAQIQKKNTLITFGGAFSNHILAVAALGFENNLKTVGIIRGEELSSKINENPTLKKASQLGMQFEFVSREMYRDKSATDFLFSWNEKYKNAYVIPEGGTNELAVKGCEEVLLDTDLIFDYICCCVGTGGTISGIINSSKPNQKILGFPALKGNFISKHISNFAKQSNWALQSDYHFGGYGKISDELIRFLNDFYSETAIPLDPIYTGKMVFGIVDLYQKNFFSEKDKVLIIHTGGLQGIAGMNQKLTKQNKQILIYENF